MTSLASSEYFAHFFSLRQDTNTARRNTQRRRVITKSIATLIFCFVQVENPVTLHAQTGHPVVRPPQIEHPPLIDGRLDDTVWQHAAHITDLVQRRPLDGAPASEASDIYLAYDSNNIYLGFYAHYKNPSMMRANRRDRDQAIEDDLFLIYLDPFLDQQRAYVFTVNGYGVQGDSILRSRGFGGGRFGVPRGDASWDVLFRAAGEIVHDGFTAEVSIPFKSLRYPRRETGTPHAWGLQIARIIGGKDEAAVWSATSRDIAGFLTQMGILDGMTDLSRTRNIEILPTFTATRFGSLNRKTGKFLDKDPSTEGGLNFKYGLTSNLTADFTLNPDFSQIESDQPQIEVNQRFALFFPELRPFFLEGAEIFNISAPIRVVHTRTIVDPFYGAKLTGKTGKTTVGVMYANDQAIENTENNPDRASEQSAQNFVGRVRYDLYSESHIGVIFTDRELLQAHSRLVGFDSNFRLGDTHSVAFRAMGTNHQDLNGIKTTGSLFNAVFRKRGRNLRYNVGSYTLSPDFKTDVGFVRRTDQRYTFANGGYRWWPEHWLRNWGPEFSYARNYDFNGLLQDEEGSGGFNFAFAKNVFVGTNVFRVMERYENINFYKRRYRLFLRVDTSRRIGLSVGHNRGDQIFFDPKTPYLGYDRGFFARFNLRPVSRLQSQINIDTRRFTDPRDNNKEIFNIKIWRALTTYQFTNRFLFRNISEYNTFDKTFDLNVLFTYRVNAGTVFYIGYDDHHQQADLIEGILDGDNESDQLFFTSARRRTNRAIFLKFQYLFRY